MARHKKAECAPVGSRDPAEERRRKKKLYRPLRATVSGLHYIGGGEGGGMARVSETRPGQTRSYKELFPDGLGVVKGYVHMKGLRGQRAAE